jgi:hydroxymethylpyrimidine/phosphomethylpyrimidine kinase
MALAACLIGYGEVGLWLQAESRKTDTWVVREENPYCKWMDEYVGEMYQTAIKTGISTYHPVSMISSFDELTPSNVSLDAIEACAVVNPPSANTLEEWRKVWEKCTRFEKAFWDMGLNLS